MRGTHLAELLNNVPSGVEEALDVVAGLDDCLAHGFTRLDEARIQALTRLAGTVMSTALGERVGEAIDKIVAGSVSDDHLGALAGARTAMLGAVHDALLASFDAACGRERAPWDAPPAAFAEPAPDNLLSGCRAWLTELAVAGWRGVDEDLVSGSSQLVEALMAVPGLRRQAVLLDGLADELRASCPIATMRHLPVRRWGDLWARALLLCRGERPGDIRAADVLSGRLLILGVDVHEHSSAVQIQVHGILEAVGEARPRLVRTSVAAAKVDTIVGPALWRLLDRYPVLLGALTERRTLDVADLPCMDSGDLVWHDDLARVGAPADPFATARVQLAGALAPAVPPLDRHPVRIAEPVILEGYTATVGEHGAVTFDVDGENLAVDVERLPSCGPLTPELVAGSSACLGLMRWDTDGWRLQPFAVQSATKRKVSAVHTGDWATDAKAQKSKNGDAVAVLRERAGRLLRK